MYNPLHIDQRVESDARSGWMRAFGRWLQTKCHPFIVHRDRPYGRKSAESQLWRRKEFDASAWAGVGDADAVRKVLKIIKDEMDWCNCNFVPDDPLWLVLQG